MHEISIMKDSDQMLQVVRWFISTLYGSYHSRCAGTNSEKKPFNPVLGENLQCAWKDKTGIWTDAHMFVEQVSHHPPVTAFAIHMPSEKPKISVQGHCNQRTVFTSSGTIKVTQYGITYLC